MASSTKEHTVRKSRNEPQARTSPLAQTTKAPWSIFRNIGDERPEIVALWCFGIGFVLGWKLKLW